MCRHVPLPSDGCIIWQCTYIRGDRWNWLYISYFSDDLVPGFMRRDIGVIFLFLTRGIFNFYSTLVGLCLTSVRKGSKFNVYVCMYVCKLYVWTFRTQRLLKRFRKIRCESIRLYHRLVLGFKYLRVRCHLKGFVI